ncbi:MAG: 5-formyltetrahydrofolate cyclo-ligase [Oscillatoriales cyanobacterium SM2_1_8]|nr:5-formyltetrahydrofolate cyclo-ligase [Oscillatoriales cyanobacterium SM2_1_8]
MLSKQVLRQQARDRRRQLSPQWVQQRSQALVDRLRHWPRWPNLGTVFLYSPLPGEPDVALLCADRTKTWGVPRCVGDRLDWHVWPPGAPLPPGRFGIGEPEPTWPRLTMESADAVLVPALMGDRQGHRLGWGAGFYDRALSTATGWRIGLLFAEFLVESLPADPWDVPMDAIVTEAAWLPISANV